MRDTLPDTPPETLREFDDAEYLSRWRKYYPDWIAVEADEARAYREYPARIGVLDKTIAAKEAADSGVRKFETGAVRSSDADKYRYDLITPIGIARVATVAKEWYYAFNQRSGGSSPYASLLVSDSIDFTMRFLSGGQGIDGMASGAMSTAWAIRCEQAGENQALAKTAFQYFANAAACSPDTPMPLYDLIPPAAMFALAETYHEGAVKYSDFNWERGMDVSSLLNHSLRHKFLWFSGDRTEPHLAHAFWNDLAAIHSYVLWPHLNKSLRGPGCKPYFPEEKASA